MVFSDSGLLTALVLGSRLLADRLLRPGFWPKAGVIHVVEGFPEEDPEVAVGKGVQALASLPLPVEKPQVAQYTELVAGSRFDRPDRLGEHPRRYTFVYYQCEIDPDLCMDRVYLY